MANGLPAAIEAAADNVPLLLLTADRPPELRETGANQTIDQVKIFGDYVRWFFDLPVPTQEIAPHVVLTTADQAAYRARRSPAGPVHLNCMFRKPLAPADDGRDYHAYLQPLAAWQEGGEPYTCYAPKRTIPGAGTVEAVARELSAHARGLLVAGRLDSAAERAAVTALAGRIRWPLLADVTSGLRIGAEASCISYYDQVLAGEAFREAHRAEAVLYVGGRVQSKRLRRYLADSPLRSYAVVRDDPARLDPDHHVTRRVEADVATFCEALAATLPAAEGSSPWQAAWQEADQEAARVLASFFSGADVLSEALAARLVTEHLPEGHGLFLASSMPVRDVDRYAAAAGTRVRVAANRGASGIDGTVASAVGLSRGLGAPVTLLIGDLALLHDLNALALLRDVPVTLVVINNDGGGIFSFLPIAAHEDMFEPYFATPHGLGSFEQAAGQFGIDYAQPDTPEAFVTAYCAAVERSRGILIEIQTDRAANRSLHDELDRRAVAALE